MNTEQLEQELQDAISEYFQIGFRHGEQRLYNHDDEQHSAQNALTKIQRLISQALQAKPQAPKSSPQLEKWIEKNTVAFAAKGNVRLLDSESVSALFAGKVLVPVEPTDKILKAISDGFPSATLSYKYMLTASQEPEDPRPRHSFYDRNGTLTMSISADEAFVRGVGVFKNQEPKQ